MADPQQNAEHDQPVDSPVEPASPTFPSSNPAAPTASGVTPPPSVPTALNLGSTLGPYRLLEKLGEGGMGAVYKAVHEHLDKVVAVKVLPQHFTQQPDSIARFKREMKAVGKLNHPHIVQAFDAGAINGTHFLAMEYVEGSDLAQLVKEHGRFSMVNACKAVRQAAIALSVAHGAGLIHRDIKPSNILVARNGQIKLLDLGLALLADDAADTTELTTAGQTFGTPDYMAPEQWENAHSADARTDLYALGCALFFLLVGRAPYGTDQYRTGASKMKGHIIDAAPDLVALVPNVPAPLVAIYQKLLEKNPTNRFQTATELVQALAPFVSSKSAPVTPIVVVPVAATVNPPPGPAPSTVSPASATPAPSASPSTATSEPLADPAGADRQATPTTSPIGKIALPPRGGSRHLLLKAGFGGVAAVLLGVIIITITNRDGTQTRIEIPDTSKVEITRKDDKNHSPLATQHSPLMPWHGWPADAPKPAIAPFDAEQAKQHQAAWAKYLNVPVEYTNTIGMKFRLIPPGEFLRGTSDEEMRTLRLLTKNMNEQRQEWLVPCLSAEQPQHRTILTQAFYIASRETTFAIFESILKATPHNSYPDPDNVPAIERPQLPALSTYWTAIDFCNVASLKDAFPPAYFRSGEVVTRLNSGGYRLPTDAEWEFACGAGSGGRFSGETSPDGSIPFGWTMENSGIRLHPVGQLAPNAFGLHDMHGNGHEFTQDWWEPKSYEPFAKTQAIDPEGAESIDPNGKQRHFTIRGGSNGFESFWARSSHRASANHPCAFRIVASIDAVRQALKVTGPAMPQPSKAAPEISNPKSQIPNSSDPIDFAAERKAAEWTRQRGRVLLATKSGETIGMFDAQSPQLPEANFQIREIDLGSAKLTNADLNTFSTCRGIQVAKIDANPLVTTEGLRAFAACTELRKLDIFGTSVGAGLDQLLDRWPRLQYLYPTHSKVDGEVWKRMPNCPQLKHLLLTDLLQSNEALIAVSLKCPNLTRILIHDESGRVTAEPLAALSQLQHISMSGIQFTRDSAESLRRLPFLEQIDLSVPSKVEQIERLARLDRRLKSLSLHFAHAAWTAVDTSLAYQVVSQLTSLEKLAVIDGHGKMSEADLLQLANSIQLKRLSITRGPNTPAKISAAGITRFREVRPDVHLLIEGMDYAPSGPPSSVIRNLDKTDPLPKWELPEGSPPPVVAPCKPEEATALQQKWAEYLKRPVVEELDVAAFARTRENGPEKKSDTPEKPRTLASAATMKFALIPPGEFRKIFTRPRDATIEPDMPVRRFRITKPYAMSTTEVTWAQFNQFVEATHYKTEAETNGVGGRDREFKQDPKITWRNPGWKPDPQEPVTQVTPKDAEAFCEWLTNEARRLGTPARPSSDDTATKDEARKNEDRTGKSAHPTFRLPTEAEWLHACRAGSVHKHVVGPDPQDLFDYVWSSDFTLPAPASPLRLVGQKKPNSFGIHDMLGNVEEWKLDSIFPANVTFLSTNDPIAVRDTGAIGGAWSSDGRTISPEGSYSSLAAPQPNIGFRILKQFDGEPLPGPLDRPLLVRPGQPLGERALVPKPTAIEGLRSWSVEMVGQRPGCEAVAWHPGGHSIVTAGTEDGSIRVWNREGKLERVLLGHSGSPYRLAFSSDGKWLATGERGHIGTSEVRVWDFDTGVCRTILFVENWPNAVAFSSDGGGLAVGTGGLIYLFDLKNGKRTVIQQSGTDELAWSPAGRKLLGRGIVTHSDTLAPIAKLEWKDNDKLFGAGAGKWSPDGLWLATNCDDGSVRIWEATKYSLSNVVKLVDRRLTVIDWTSDNQLLIQADDKSGRKTIKWDVVASQVVSESALMPAAQFYALSPDATQLAFYRREGSLAIYDLTSGMVFAEGATKGQVTIAESLSPNGQELVGSRGQETWLFNSIDGTPSLQLKSANVKGVQWSPDSRKFLRLGSSPRVFEVIDRVTQSSVELVGSMAAVQTFSWAPDSKTVAIAYTDGNIVIWDVVSGKKVSEWEGPDKEAQYYEVRWSPDGTKLATTYRNYTMLIWDLKTKTILNTIQIPKEVGPLAYLIQWMPGSEALWVKLNTTITKVDLATGTFSPQEGCSGGAALNHLALSPDGRQLLVCSFGPVKYRTDDSAFFLGNSDFSWTGPVWMPDNRRALLGGTGYDIEKRQKLGTLYPWVTGDHWLCIGPTGHYRGSPGVEEQIVYVAMHEDGSQVTYSPQAFTEKFGWKNDPEKATLLKLDGE